MSRSNVITVAIAAVAIALSGWSLFSTHSLTNQVGDLSDNLSTVSQRVSPQVNLAPAKTDAVDIRHDPADLPGPIHRTAPQKVIVNLTATEVNGKLADGVTYTYWTFNRTVPGPMIRVQQGDTVELHLKNDPTSTMVHSIDLHAVNGPGGGASVMQVKPGEEQVFTFQAITPGVFVYHCASPSIPAHIAEGMYGLIVVEPKGGLPPVDKEFYLMQGEIYANGTHMMPGHQAFDSNGLMNDQPSYVVFNGAYNGLTTDKTMKVKVGDKVRIFVGDGGPNLTSSFHIIGTIFDTVHPEGATEATSNIQTTLIPAGGAAWVEFTIREPGRYVVVDHSMTNGMLKGAMAYIDAEGAADPNLYSSPMGMPAPGQGGH